MKDVMGAGNEIGMALRKYMLRRDSVQTRAARKIISIRCLAATIIWKREIEHNHHTWNSLLIHHVFSGRLMTWNERLLALV
jgi:hypothetical protein